jgi:hypothetical protein
MANFLTRPRNGGLRPGLESLDRRVLLAAVTVDAGQVVRAVDSQLLGVNLANYDTLLNTTTPQELSQEQQVVQDDGFTLFRFPGGSNSDDSHFNELPSVNEPGFWSSDYGTASTMASFIASVDGQAVVTLDYGSGSPQEAAAFLAYLNAPVSNTTTIGTGPQWDEATASWQTIDWMTAAYWANLRASAPLAQDDGLNFLRLDQPAPFGFHYFEVGNEVYGPWEDDHHTNQHDPATYAAFADQFATLAAAIDPTISIGIPADVSFDDNAWVTQVLQLGVTQGFSPGFISDHNYVQAPGSENDSTLLLHTVTDPDSTADWAVRATQYEQMLTNTLGASAAQNVELLTTEFNSVSDPNMQSTSLVDGLFVADSLGALLETPYDGAIIWDLYNGYENDQVNQPGLYGWRQGGDTGLLGSGSFTSGCGCDTPPPATGVNVPYPAYFAEQLASKIIQAGGTVVSASSNDPNLSTYAVVEPNGDLDLLVINKSASDSLTGQFQIANFTPSAQANVWQYGQDQDTAQSQTTDGQSALTNFATALTLNGSSFSYSFPAYSMTVLDLDPMAAPIVSTQAATALTSTGATLNATVNPAGTATTVTFTYGTDPTLTTGTIVTTAEAIGSGATDVAVTAALTNLTAGTTYFFQVVATNPVGTTDGSIFSFSTAATAEPASLQFAAGQFTANVTDGSATIVLTSSFNPADSVTVVLSSPGGPEVAAFQQTITFGPNTQNTTVSIPIFNDGRPGESDVSIVLALSSPGAGATIGATGSATLVIHDNNAFPAPATITSLQLPTVRVGTGHKAKKVRVIQLQFNEAVNGAGNLAAYQLLSGKSKKGVTTFTRNVPLASALYNPAANTVTLFTKGKLNLSPTEQLQVAAGLITDAFGRPLDGNPDGQADRNFVATFGNHLVTFEAASRPFQPGHQASNLWLERKRLVQSPFGIKLRVSLM